MKVCRLNIVRKLKQRRFFLQAISFVVVASFIVLSLSPLLRDVLAYVIPHPHEQTASFLPPDTEVYASVNLRPGLGQLLELKEFVDSVQQNDATTEITSEFVDKVERETGINLEQETGINLQQDILPYLVEIGVGIRGISTPSPQLIVMVDIDSRVEAENVYTKYKAWRQGSFYTYTVYRGITIERRGGNDEYYALLTSSTNYIFASNRVDFLYEVIDLTLDGGTSLADTADFQAAQAALTGDRVGMLYCNTAKVWQDVLSRYNNNPSLEVFSPYIPPYAAASIGFADGNLKIEIYSPTYEGMSMEAQPANPLDMAGLVPNDALMFLSAQSLDDLWQSACGFRDEHVSEGWAQSFRQAIDSLSSQGINLSDDVFSWLDGETSFAVLSPWNWQFGAPLAAIPDYLLMSKVEPQDQQLVSDKLQEMITSAVCAYSSNPQELRFTSTTIDGVDANLVSLPGSPYYLGTSTPGYLFLGDYLVIGASYDALRSAVNAYNHPQSSLSQASSFQDVAAQMSQDGVGLVYLDLQASLDYFLAMASLFLDSPQDFADLCRGDVRYVVQLACLELSTSIEGSLFTVQTDIGTIDGKVVSINDGVVTINTDLGTVEVDISHVNEQIETSGITINYWIIGIVALLIVTLLLALVVAIRRRQRIT